MSTSLLNDRNDFPHRIHHLQRWFGVSEFIVISSDYNSQSDAMMILSALQMAFEKK